MPTGLNTSARKAAEEDTSAYAGAPTVQQLLFEPNVSINGLIDNGTVPFFLSRLQAVRQCGTDLLMELNTDGGNADSARRIALEVRLFYRHSGRNAYCVGKSNVYSAGVTILAAFPKQCRFLTEDGVLLVHERHMEANIELKGPLKSCLHTVREQLALLETAERLEMEGFVQLAEGSLLDSRELSERAKSGWYLHAEEALRLGLIAGIVR